MQGLNLVAVSTRVPSNVFSYGEGQSITVAGEIYMKLYGSDGSEARKLAEVTNFGSGAKEERAAFRLQIALDSLLESSQVKGGEIPQEASSTTGDMVFLLLIGAVVVFGLIIATCYCKYHQKEKPIQDQKHTK